MFSGPAILALAKAYWKPLAILAIVAGLYAYHHVAVAWAHHQGVIDGKAEMQIKLDAAAVENSTLRAQVKDANAKVEAAVKASADAKAASDMALADEQAKTKVWQQQATRYIAIFSRPKSHDPLVCTRADSLLDDGIRGLR